MAAVVEVSDGRGANRVEITHHCPPGQQSLTPCCGKTPFELPHTDRMTLDPAMVTCGRTDWTTTKEQDVQHINYLRDVVIKTDELRGEYKQALRDIVDAHAKWQETKATFDYVDFLTRLKHGRDVLDAN